MNLLADHPEVFRVRRGFLLSCMALTAAFFLPSAIAHRHNVQLVFLAASALATAFGWLFLRKEGIPNSSWRSVLAITTCAFLTLSLPAFFIEVSASMSFAFAPHQWTSLYLRPWARWGMLLALLAVIASFFARPRARVALVTGSILLMVVRFSIPWWWY